MLFLHCPTFTQSSIQHWPVLETIKMVTVPKGVLFQVSLMFLVCRIKWVGVYNARVYRLAGIFNLAGIHQALDFVLDAIGNFLLLFVFAKNDGRVLGSYVIALGGCQNERVRKKMPWTTF